MSQTDSDIILIDDTHHMQPQPYTTLSYCWGKQPTFVRTVYANLQEHRTAGIKLYSLPLVSNKLWRSLVVLGSGTCGSMHCASCRNYPGLEETKFQYEIYLPKLTFDNLLPQVRTVLQKDCLDAPVMCYLTPLMLCYH